MNRKVVSNLLAIITMLDQPATATPGCCGGDRRCGCDGHQDADGDADAG
jgi:hypothetical protein